MLTHFHFLRPYVWFAILPLLFLWWRLWHARHLSQAWQAVCDPHLLPHLMNAEQSRVSKWPFYLIACAWFIALFALAGPSWNRLPQITYEKQQATVIAFDLSQQMLATDVHPSRVTRAKYKIQDILKRYTEGQIGLVVFSNEAYVVSPLTFDSATISDLVKVLAPELLPVHGNNITVGLTEAMKLLQQANFKKGKIILITASPLSASDLTMAKNITNAGYTLSVLGVGTEAGAPVPTTHGFLQDESGELAMSKLDADGLRRLAKLGHGDFRKITQDDSDLDVLMANEVSEPLSANKTHTMVQRWQDQGYLFILFLLPIALLGFSRQLFTALTE